MSSSKFWVVGIAALTYLAAADASAGCPRGTKWNPYRNSCTKRITCRDAGLTYNSSTGSCNWDSQAKKEPRYKGRGEKKNDKCNRRPAAQDMSGFRMANSRIPYVQPKILNYLKKLKAVCPGLGVESTYRTCQVNAGLRGSAKNSRHLCGGAADTSGCPDRRSKALARKICKASGLYFIDEGSGRFPHCQIQGHCE